VLNNCIDGDKEDSISYNNDILGLNRNKIDIITSNGNWNYHKLINCSYRKIVKIKKDKRGKFLRDEKNNLVKDIIKKEYRNDNNKLIDCDKHIIDKSETCLVETMNGGLRGRFARFNRKTKSYSKSYIGLYNAVFLWVNRDILIENRIRYSSYCNKNECNSQKNVYDQLSSDKQCQKERVA
jgi:IS1 family transposase